MKGLLLKALAGLMVTLLVMAALLFLAAGSIRYWQAWAFLGVFGGSGLVITLYLMKHDPKLLERRVHGGPMAEKERTQRIIMSFASLGFIVIVVVSALDHRVHAAAVPAWLAWTGDGLILCGWAFVVWVFRVNTYTSATIEVADGQRVISTGPYAVVRHPMYSGSLLYLFGMPIALGSWWGFAAVFAMLPALIWRLLDEEKFLVANLAGYAEYRERVKYRLVPRVW